ncbi:MAG: hypothetical protein KR126chlam3_00553 [Chlamydiae bacterium]|nr:hypothetical protein [Chlamydiota bacterium]
MRLIGLKTLIVISLLSLAGCDLAKKEIQPQIHYTVQDRYLQSLPSPFSELSTLERETSWGSEYLIGNHFAKKLDFYRAITAFRRAEILTQDEDRRLEAQYETLLCYYLGQRYAEVEQSYRESNLSSISTNFPAFHDLLVILYDTYFQLGEVEKSTPILELLGQYDEKTAKTLVLYSALQKADFSVLEKLGKDLPLMKIYEEQKKSSKIAAALNAIIPGSGYFYLGQKNTAITALLMNGLFLAAAIYFFRRRPIAAAIIFLGFEAGWYLGGIQGGSAQGKLYNERVYEQIVTPYMNREGIFPIYQLKNAF